MDGVAPTRYASAEGTEAEEAEAEAEEEEAEPLTRGETEEEAPERMAEDTGDRAPSGVL
jgi:hypothetical protein